MIEVTASVDTEVAVQINDLHRKITAPGSDVIRSAIECGELLIKVQQSVPKGQWVMWAKANLEMHVTTAFGYMRLARNKVEVLAGNHSGIDPALAALSGEIRLGVEAKQEIVRLYDNGKGQTLEQIADLFGVKKSTVWYHVSAKSRNRTKLLQRTQRAQARRALEREEQSRAAQRLGGPIAEAYSLVRKAEQIVDARTRLKIDVDERRHLMEALTALYTVEDELSEAIRRSQ